MTKKEMIMLIVQMLKRMNRKQLEIIISVARHI